MTCSDSRYLVQVSCLFIYFRSCKFLVQACVLSPGRWVLHLICLPLPPVYLALGFCAVCFAGSRLHKLRCEDVCFVQRLGCDHWTVFRFWAVRLLGRNFLVLIGAPSGGAIVLPHRPPVFLGGTVTKRVPWVILHAIWCDLTPVA